MPDRDAVPGGYPRGMADSARVMPSFVCGEVLPDYDWPDTGGTCCEGAALEGPRECACWLPEFNGIQEEPEEALGQLIAAGGVLPTVRPGGMCGSCAYRPDSPEMTGHPDARGNPEWLDEIAALGERFWCHQDMLLTVRWRHPSGVVVEPDEQLAYVPPIVSGVPYRLNGKPGFLCAGWNARNKAWTARLAKEGYAGVARIVR